MSWGMITPVLQEIRLRMVIPFHHHFLFTRTRARVNETKGAVDFIRQYELKDQIK